MRVRFVKTGMMRFISHIEFMEVVKRALRIADAPVAMTRGFNKRERVSAGFPTPLGIESESELVDVDLFEPAPVDIIARVNAGLPDGISAASVRVLEGKESIMAETAAIEYRVTADEVLIKKMSASLDARIAFVKKTKKSEKEVPFDRVVHSHDVGGAGSLLIRLFSGSEDSVRIDEVARALAGSGEDALRGLKIAKTAQYRGAEGKLELIG